MRTQRLWAVRKVPRTLSFCLLMQPSSSIGWDCWVFYSGQIITSLIAIHFEIAAEKATVYVYTAHFYYTAYFAHR